MIYNAPWSPHFSGFFSAPPLDYLVLSHCLLLPPKNLDFPGHGTLPGRAGAGQTEDTWALKLELPGAAPAPFLGQQVQPVTDTKIHSQGEGRRAKQERGSAPPPTGLGLLQRAHLL